MHRISLPLLACLVFITTKALAFGVDIGPVHVHGTKVKVGSSIELKIIPEKIVRDEDEKDRVRKISAHRKGDTDDKFEIKVIWADLDDESKEILKKMEKENIYVMKLEKMDDDWKLLKVRKVKDEDDDSKDK